MQKQELIPLTKTPLQIVFSAYHHSTENKKISIGTN